MRFQTWAILSCGLALAACAGNPPPAPATIETAPMAPRPPAPPPVADLPLEQPPSAEPAPAAASAPPPTRTLDGYLAALRSASCPPGTPRAEPEAIPLAAKPVALQALNPSRKAVGNLTLLGSFHLTSPDNRFGGLSGIDVLDNGNLLAVSDQGDFVWIDLARDGATPASARIAPLRDASGAVLRGKADGDSEGIALNGGMALVSFERNHRVLAYDVASCGASARGAPLALGGMSSPMPAAFAAAKIDVDSNQGAEALAVTRDWYLFAGLETKAGNESPLSARPLEAPFEFNLRLGEGAPEFVGLDLVESADGKRIRAFSLHRSFSPLSGNAITLIETGFERELDQANLPARIVGDIDERSHYRFRETGRRRLAELNFLYTIDNFEGLAARQMPDGRIRLYLISDDNFSDQQRTLFYVFELAK